ncbi:MAG TPA: ADOP family duplicated permease [Bryobacteraceae bacterium]|nr:ADOP family duplicated permease [Bryobacteraceae bacterium]
MTWLVSLFQRFQSLRNRRQLDRDLEDELGAHLAFKQSYFEKEGLSPEEAVRRARLAVGNPTIWKESTREQWSFAWLESLWQDVVFGTRILLKDRIFTTVALITLAIGVGGNAAIFTLLNSLLWRGLPVRDPQQLVRIRVIHLPPTDRAWINGRATAPKERRRIPFQLFEALGKQDLFEGVFGIAGEDTAVAEIAGAPYQVRICTVTGSYFPVLGVEPGAGRLLTPGDDVAGGPSTGWGAVISDAMWTRLFDRRADTIGTRIAVERIPFKIIGVAPPRFHGVNPGVEPDMWLPVSVLETMFPKSHWRSDVGLWMLETVARLKPGVSIDQARQQIVSMSQPLLEGVKPPAVRAEDEKHFLAMKLDLVSARSGFSYLVEIFSPALWTLMAAVGGVLLIAATNLTNLLLARSTARRQEISVRLALGASPNRIRRQLLVESTLLAAAGTGLGIIFAQWLVDALVKAASSAEDPIRLEAPVDWNVLVFLAIVLSAVVLIAGWAPAWSAVRGVIHEGTKAHAGSRTATYFRSSLIVVQIAFSLVLLGGAGLLLASLRSLLREATGFDTTHTVFVSPDLFNAGISRERMPGAYATLLREARQLPGVRGAAWTMYVPFTGALETLTIELPSHPEATLNERMVYSHQVTDGYFASAGIPVIAGHDFAPRGSGGPKGAIVSENLAKKFFGSPQAALGQRLKPGNLDWTQIVGVAADAKFQNIREPDPFTVYTSYWEQQTTLGMALVLNYSGPREPLVSALRILFEKEAGRSPFTQVSTLPENIASSVATERTLAALLTAFAVFALVIAATGLAGLLSYTVQVKRREIGIRIALGATPGLIAGQLHRYCLRLAVVGIASGGLLSFWLRRAIETYLFRTDPGDWIVWLSVCALILLCAVGAGAIPARRAARLDPMRVLRLD